jgi:hypothetical protein
MPDFDITIKTPTELAGAVQAAEALERDIGKAKALGQEFSELQQRLERVKQSIASADPAPVAGLGKEAEKSGEGFKLLGHGAHEAHAGVHALSDAFPGIQGFARFMASGMTAAIGAAALGFSYLKGQIDEFSKMLDEIDSGPGARGEWLEKMKEAAEQATVEMAVFNHELERQMNLQQTISQLAERKLAHDREGLAAANEIAAANKELDEARLALAEKLGQITPEQAIKLRLEIDEAYFKQQAEQKVKELQLELESAQGTRQKLSQAAPAAADKADAAAAAAEAAKAAKVKNDERIAQERKDLAASEEAAKKAQEQVDQYSAEKGSFGFGLDKTDADYWKLKAAREQVESEERRQAGLKRAIKQGEEKAPALDTAAETTKKDADDAEKEYAESVKQQRDLANKVQDLQQTLASEQAKVAALEALHDQTAETKAQGETVDEQMKRDAARQEQEKNAGFIDNQFAQTPSGQVDQAVLDADAAMANAQQGLDPSGAGKAAAIARLIDLVQHLAGKTDAQDAELHQRIDQLEGLVAGRGPRS